MMMIRNLIMKLLLNRDYIVMICIQLEISYP